ncbi:MAG: M48 family metallopeptidase [candidate division Zixibacteria bacterium]|nr:M48 family metallopeptidase [candidate division Zixibacteria bacterium]
MRPVKLFLFITFFALLAIPSMSSQPNETELNDSAVVLADSTMETVDDSLAVVASTEDDFLYPMSPERKEKMISYSKFKNIWRFASFFIGIAFLLIVLFTKLSARFRLWANAVSKKKLVEYSIYIILFTLFMYLINLPIDYYRNFLIEHEYGFSNQTGGEWFIEGIKALGLEIFFSVLIISTMYWLINKTKRWWLYFALGSIPFLVFFMLVYPVVITPMFNEFKPLQDKVLAAEMTALAESAGIHDPDIYEVDGSKQSNKINAYFVGMFGTKRIVLYDTIIKNFTVDELKFVMAHEIGHYLKNHIWYGLFSAIIMIFLICWLINKLLHNVIRRHKDKFGFDRLGNIASLPLIMLFISIFGFVYQPITNGMSRVMEYQSDRFGMELSKVTDDAAVTAFDKLSVYNLSDPDPSDIIEFWFYSHPTLKKRMTNVREIYKEIN